MKNKHFESNGKSETRSFAIPDIEANADENIVTGHAAVFGQKTLICGWFYETIERGAFDKTDFTDVPFFVNHNLDEIPLARSRNNNENSTLQLAIDDQGLKIGAKLDTENNNNAKALYSAVKRGDISGMSFNFTVSEDEWTGLDTDKPSRTIKEIAKVWEVSAVSFPAYDGTDINARNSLALESAKSALESARANELESSEEQRNEIEKLKLKTQILMKG